MLTFAVDNAVQTLLKGTTLLKLTVHKKLYSRHFRLDPDQQTLIYHDPATKRYQACQAKFRLSKKICITVVD